MAFVSCRRVYSFRLTQKCDSKMCVWGCGAVGVPDLDFPAASLFRFYCSVLMKVCVGEAKSTSDGRAVGAGCANSHLPALN